MTTLTFTDAEMRQILVKTLKDDIALKDKAKLHENQDIMFYGFEDDDIDEMPEYRKPEKWEISW